MHLLMIEFDHRVVTRVFDHRVVTPVFDHRVVTRVFVHRVVTSVVHRLTGHLHPITNAVGCVLFCESARREVDGIVTFIYFCLRFVLHCSL